MIRNAPFIYGAALIVGWVIGWGLIRAWYRRSIRIGEARLSLAENERDIERRQKEGLRQVILELKPGARVLAMEIGHGDPELRTVVESLAKGKTITTPVDPSKAPVGLTASDTEEDLKNIARLSIHQPITSLRSLVSPSPITSAGTAHTIGIIKYINPDQGTNHIGAIHRRLVSAG